MKAPRASERVSSALLLACMTAGGGLAATGVIDRGGPADSGAVAPGAIPDGAVAVVDGVPISSGDYEASLAAFAADRRTAVGDSERRHVLDRLIDEELLVQRALALGLAGRDPRIRNELVAAMVDAITGEAVLDAGEPDTQTLRAWYDTHRDRYQEAARYRIEPLLFAAGPTGDDDARARAEAARARLIAGDSTDAVRTAADPPPAPLPEGAHTLDVIAEYTGPSVARAVADLEPGEVSPTIRSFGGYHVVRLAEREDGAVPAFEGIHDAVREDWEREVAEQALQQWLAQAREEAGVRVEDDP